MMVDDGEENPLQALIYAREGVCNPILFKDMDSLNPADNNTTKSTGFRTKFHYFVFRRFQIFELNVFKSWLQLCFVCKLEKTWVRICDEFRRIFAIIERRPLDWGLNLIKLDDTNFKSW